jgi:type II secretory pathway component PulM
MKSGYLSNLRPSERRLVVGIGVVFFVVINFWFIIPQFGEWGRVQARMWEAQEKLSVYQKEIAMKSNYEKVVRQMESEGQSVPAEEQTVQFSRTIQNKQAESGVQIISTSKMNVRTNQFFIDQGQSITLQAQESQLVDFLYNLGTGNSLIRVRELSLRPDPPRQNLVANATLVASYQKKVAAKPGSGTAPAQPGGATPKTASSSSTITTAKRP